MKSAIIPFNAKVRSCSIGPTFAGTLVPGENVVGYRYEDRRGTAITLTEVRPLGRKEALNILLLGVAYVILGVDTVIVTRTGEKRIEDVPDHMIGTCILNPNQLLTRQVSIALPVPDTEMVELVWDGPEYLLVEGLLAGSYQQRDQE